MIFELANESISIKINSLGAELSSLKSQQTGIEYLWTADSKYWGRHSPVLFPFIGQSKNKQYTYKGQSYPMGNHGFARGYEFTVREQSQTKLVLELSDNDETRKVYPFSFSLAISYSLAGDSLKISYAVTNPAAEEDLYYSVGGHPGFNVPLVKGTRLEDYQLSFKNMATAKVLRLHDTLEVLLDDSLTTESPAEPLPLKNELFQQGLFAYELAGDIECSLESAKTEHGLTISTENMNHLCIWSPEEPAPFVCIEPWQGIPDYMDATGDITEKRCINKLAPQASSVCGYTITIK